MSVRQPIPTLEELRSEIDAIDTALHDLLMRRASASDSIARVKNRGRSGDAPLAIRPAREAAILRRLLARHSGGMPLQTIVSVWREIISASLQAQTVFRLHVYAADGKPDLAELTHAYFGALTPLHTHKHASQVLHACAEDPYSLGIAPLPKDDDAAWWSGLAPSGQDGPRVIAKLPFLVSGEPPQSAYVIGPIEQEPTGDDSTLLLVETQTQLSRTRLETLLKQAGLEAHVEAASRSAKKGDPTLLLLATTSFVPADDGRLVSLVEAASKSIVRAVTVGGFATPLVLSDEAKTGSET